MSNYIPGKISKGWTEYIVQCKSCNNNDVIHWKTMKQAIQNLREHGWSKKNGNWHCPKCCKRRK